MAINERLIHTAGDAGSSGNAGEEGLILHLDANDVDSYDGDGSEWVDITDHEYTPATNVSEHFNTVLYTGNETSQSITGTGFQPDLIWVKNRDTTNNHLIFDSIRGNNFLIPNGLFIESTSGSNTLSSFDSDGFSISGGGGSLNNNSDDYVAWCFKAGGAPSGSDKVSIDGTSYATMSAAELTDGTELIDKLSVNTKLGFSIVKYTAPALTGDTVAHGLGESPEMIILKSTSAARNWNVFHKDVGLSKNLHLNTTDSANTGEYWTANSSTFSIQDYSSSADWIAYCFASKRGVSKVGSFTGTGVAGNKIYTGFEPAFILTKRTSTSGSGWYIIDNKRSTDSDKNDYLAVPPSNEEVTSSSSITFNRDGFTFNGGSFNTSSQTHIYYAVAKNTNETELIKGETTTTSYSQDGTENFYNFVSSITSTSTSGTFNSTTLQDSTALIGFGDNGTTEANNTVNFAMSQPVSVDGFLVGESEQSYRGYTGTCKFYGSTDGNTYTLLGSTQQKASGFALSPTRTAKTATFSASVGYSYFRMTISNMQRGTYGGIYDFIPSVADNDFDVSITTGADPILHLDAASFDGSTNTPTTWTALTGSNGTISGAAFDSELGNWLDFDGVNDEVNWSTFPTAFESLTAITMELWVKFDTVSGTQYPIWLGRAASGKSVNIGLVGGKIQTWVGVSGFPSLFTPVANKWYHLVVTISGSTQAVYVDGEDYTNNSSTSGISMDSNASNVFLLGDYSGGTADFNGKIGQVRIYPSAITQDNIRQNYNFTKPSYPNGYDFSGINMNSSDWNSEGYFDFDGSSEYFNNTDISLDTSKQFSVSVWFYPTQDSEWQRIFAFGTASTEFILQKRADNNNSRTIARVSNSIKFDVTGPALPNNTWHLGVVTGDGSNIKMYINNSAAVTDSIDGAYVYNNLQIGFGTGTSEYFTGRVANLKVYDRVLSAAEITTIHSNGR